MLAGQRNGGSEHTVRIETTFQRSQPDAVAAVSIVGLLADERTDCRSWELSNIAGFCFSGYSNILTIRP
jgi:hypothetical protein